VRQWGWSGDLGRFFCCTFRKKERKKEMKRKKERRKEIIKKEN
jgi:hypothetical protein